MEKDTAAFNEIATALAKAQKDFKVIKKSKQGQIGNQTYKYAQLADVIEAIREPLAENGLAFTQVIKPIENKDFLVTTLLHTSGQKIESFYGLPDPRNLDPKAYGKNLTYARRYSLSAVVGVESEEDTDGGGAEEMGNKTPPANNNKKKNNQRSTPRNHAPQSRKLNKKEINTIWARLKDEFNFSGDDVKLCVKSMFNKGGLGDITIVEASKFMEQVEKEGKNLVSIIEATQDN